MNFIDYLIATKNYSTLNVVSEYTKQFGLTNQDITSSSARHYMAQDLNKARKEKDPDIRRLAIQRARNTGQIQQAYKDAGNSGKYLTRDQIINNDPRYSGLLEQRRQLNKQLANNGYALPAMDMHLGMTR